ncbi:DUF2484 family protein [Roseicyclus persicicus]|uniref:DUF2484 family protein n=1 Tax=Roseicyclus persicicus TaxID=2650661 RepID=A0A7X6JYJ6_9RHOB|nr:DUF2484 family protein [Roseibacterium persicicum]NKX43858.1 DUF2484 family protein [Roseibacterium persicicum]
MPLSLTLASLWVVAAAAVAMLPMRWQWGPGLLLLILAGPLLVLIGREVGWPWVAAVLLAILSMFRRPLFGLARHLHRRLTGSA